MNRKLINNIFSLSAKTAFSLSLLLLVFLLTIIAFNGLKAINWNFITGAAKDFGAKGGIVYQIMGSLLLVFTAALIVFPVALGTALYKSEFLKNKRLQKISSLLIYKLNGVPSIVFGLFGLIFFMHILGFGLSWFVGSIILAVMILPTVIMSAFQSINSIPQIYREAAYSLGLNKWQVIIRVLIRQGIDGAVTGLFIGLARAIGETAPVMFIATAFSGVKLPSSLFEPVSTLPTHILALVQQATNPKALRNAWGAGLVLICLVIIFSTSSLIIRKRLQTYKMR